MRVVRLSDHPGEMVADHVRKRQSLVAEQEARLAAVREDRDRARSEGRWLAWLRLWPAVRREERDAATQRRLSGMRSSSEQIARAGVDGEQVMEDGLQALLPGDDWVLFRGYSNYRGEIDGLLLGPRGLFAIEAKKLNRTLTIRGDNWTGERVDNYGISHSEPPPADARGRSPSQQLIQAAEALTAWLRKCHQDIVPVLVVFLAHPNARIRAIEKPTVMVVRSMSAVLDIAAKSSITLDSKRQARIESLIQRDHEHYKRRQRLQ